MTGRTLLVASPGGHVDELYDFTPRLLGVGEDRTWVTAATPQTTRLLAQEDTAWVPPIASRQAGRAALSLPRALSLLHRYRPARVVSTGAALAVPYLLAARAHGVETHYIESATRFDGPSLTGRIIGGVPGAQLHHQGFRATTPRWKFVGSVFDAYAPGPDTQRSVSSVVVTLGTERYPFPRALARAVPVLRPGMQVLVQTGRTPALPALASRAWVPYDELTAAIARADVVITHAGVGSVLSVLRAGKHPVVIPRLAQRGEHVDDHQLELSHALEARGLVTTAGAYDDLAEAVDRAARRTTIRVSAEMIQL